MWGAFQTIMIMDRGGFNTTAGAGTGHYTLFLNKSTTENWQLGFQSGDGSSNSTFNTTFQNWDLQDGAWHHLGFNFAYNPTGDNGVDLWLDGSVVGTGTVSVDITSGANDNTTKRFSAGERATSTFLSKFDGSMDDVFVTTGLHSFQAIPEPGVVSLLLLGGGLLMMRSRRRC